MPLTLPQLFFRNSNWVFVEKLSKAVVTGLVSILVARYLGSDGLGKVSIVITIYTIFSMFSTLGLERVLLKELSEKKIKVNTLIGGALLIRAISACIGIVLINTGSIFYFSDSHNIQLMIAVVSTALLLAIGNVFEVFYRYTLRSQVVAAIRLAGLLLAAFTKLLIIFFDADIIWFSVAVVLETLLISICYTFAIRKEEGSISITQLDFSLTEGKRLFKYSWPLILSGLVGTLYFHLDKLLIYSYLDESSLGRYALLVQVVSITLFLFAALNMSAIPILNSLYQKNKQLYWEKYQEVTALKFLISILLVLPFILFGSDMIAFLAGDEFKYETKLMVSFSCYITLVSIGALKTEHCVLIGLTKPILVIRIISLTTNFIFNFILIPTLGLFGAAIATVISYGVNEFIAPMLYKDMRIALKNELLALKKIISPEFYKNLKHITKKAL